MRVPANAAALHCPRRCHRLCELGAYAEVEGAAIDVLAVLCYSKRCAGENGIVCGSAISREYGSLSFVNGGEHISKEVDDADIDLSLLAGVMIAQKYAKFFNYPVDRAFVVTVTAFEVFPRMSMD